MRTIKGLLLVASLACVAVGCAGSSEDESDSAAGAISAEEAAKQSGKKTKQLTASPIPAGDRARQNLKIKEWVVYSIDSYQSSDYLLAYATDGKDVLFALAIDKLSGGIQIAKFNKEGVDKASGKPDDVTVAILQAEFAALSTKLPQNDSSCASDLLRIAGNAVSGLAGAAIVFVGADLTMVSAGLLAVLGLPIASAGAYVSLLSSQDIAKTWRGSKCHAP